MFLCISGNVSMTVSVVFLGLCLFSALASTMLVAAVKTFLGHFIPK